MTDTGTLNGRSEMQWQILALLKVDLRYSGKYWNSSQIVELIYTDYTFVSGPVDGRTDI